MTTNPQPRSVLLYEGPVGPGTSNYAELRFNERGDLVMEAQDVGAGPASYLDGSTGSDYEWFISVKRRDLHKLAKALGLSGISGLLLALEQKFGGRPRASEEYREFLDEHAVPREFFCW